MLVDLFAMLHVASLLAGNFHTSAAGGWVILISKLSHHLLHATATACNPVGCVTDCTSSTRVPVVCIAEARAKLPNALAFLAVHCIIRQHTF
jgi:hypothetical protein